MKKSVNIPAIITAVIAVGLISVVAVLGVRFKNNSKVIEAVPSDYGTENVLDIGTITTEDSTTYAPPVYVPSTTAPSTTAPSTAAAVSTITTTQSRIKEVISSVKETVTASNGTTSQIAVAPDATLPVLNEDDLEKGSAPTVGTTVATGEMPKDMYFSGLHSMGYKVIGPKQFIYNNDTDPNCTQRKFGYNALYDAGAKLIDFSIETAKFDFTYDNKEYRIQLWKGQYISGDIGTVGGEVGIYTRPVGSTSAIGHYNCAAESDWLMMELTVMWDEFDNGEYLPQLTRKYAIHWWETGYVDGQLKNRRDSSPLRLLNRITFKDETQASLFEQQLVKHGFRSVAQFNPTIKDTCKRFGKDVIYIWQDVR